MAVPEILNSPHANDKWFVETIRDGFQPESHLIAHVVDSKWGKNALNFDEDRALADFVAAAPKMARALTAVLNLDLTEADRRLVKAEISHILG